MKKATLTREINKKYRFKIEIDDGFTLDYTSPELRWSAFENEIDRNVKLLEDIAHEYWSSSLIDPWKELQHRIGTLREESLSFEESEEMNLSDWLASQLPGVFGYPQPVVSEIDEQYVLYTFNVSSVTESDLKFSEIYAFLKWASERCAERKELCDSRKIVENFVAISRDPSCAYTDFSSRNPHEKLPNLYMLIQELSYGDRVAEFTEGVCSSSRAQLTAAQKDLRESDQEFRSLFFELKEKMEVFQGELDSWKTDQQGEIDSLKKRYRENLALEEPKRVWDAAAEEHTVKTRYWAKVTAGTIVLSLIVSAGGIALVDAGKFPELPWLSPSFIVLALITFLVYVIRVFIKVTLSNSHLAAAYRQKATMTYFYLALMEKEHAVDDPERPLVLSALFSPVDTGLVKSGESVGLDALASLALKKV